MWRCFWPAANQAWGQCDNTCPRDSQSKWEIWNTYRTYKINPYPMSKVAMHWINDSYLLSRERFWTVGPVKKRCVPSSMSEKCHILFFYIFHFNRDGQHQVFFILHYCSNIGVRHILSQIDKIHIHVYRCEPVTINIWRIFVSRKVLVISHLNKINN